MSASQELGCNNPGHKPTDKLENYFNISGKSDRRNQLVLEQVGRDGCENM